MNSLLITHWMALHAEHLPLMPTIIGTRRHRLPEAFFTAKNSPKYALGQVWELTMLPQTL